MEALGAGSVIQTSCIARDLAGLYFAEDHDLAGGKLAGDVFLIRIDLSVDFCNLCISSDLKYERMQALIGASCGRENFCHSALVKSPCRDFR